MSTKGSRRRKRQKKAATLSRAFAEDKTPRNQDGSQPFILLSGYEGANNSETRGWLYWRRDADTRRELDDFSDAELRRRAHALYANTGIARRIVDGPANMLGVVTPQPVTADEEWNDAAFDSFQNLQGSSAIYDRKGNYNFFTAQPQINSRRRLDGRLIGVFGETSFGGAQMMFYEAHQNVSPARAANGRFEQGCRLDRMDRVTAFALKDGKNPSKFYEIPARSAIYYGNRDNFGSIHGISVLAHAIPNLTDVVELTGMIKHSSKVAADVALVVEKSGTKLLQLPNGGFLGVNQSAETETVDVSTGENGETVTEERKVPTNWEQMVSSGMPDLEPGQTVKIVYDERPSQNTQDFHRTLIEDAIRGGNIPPESLYSIRDLTGPGVRFVMEDVKRWIALEHLKIAEESARFWNYHIAKEIEAGRLWQPEFKGELIPWWQKSQTLWIGQPDMTIDRGREGGVTISRLESGLGTWADSWAELGAYAPKKIRQRIDEFARAKAEVQAAAERHKVPLTMGEIFPRFAESQPAAEAA